MIEFARVWAFLALPLPLAAWFLLPPSPARGAVAVTPGVWRVFARHGGGGALAGVDPGLVLRLVGWIALVCAAAGPGLRGAPLVERPGRDLIIAVDVSASMAEPLAGDAASRLTHVRDVLGAFVEARRGDRLGLIAFGEAAHLIAPPTHDAGAVRGFLDELAIGLAGRRTDLGQAAGLALKTFQPDGAEERIVILVTDGETNAGDLAVFDVADLAARRGVVLHIVGFSDDLAPETAGRLAEIAARAGGRFLAASDRAGFEAVAAELDRLAPVRRPDEPAHLVRDLAWAPLGLALAAIAAIGWRELRS